MADNLQPVTVSEPALLIRINKLFEPGMSGEQLYDTTRGVWVLSERREKAKYAFAVYHGRVLEVYSIAMWHSAGTTKYLDRYIDRNKYGNRWEFTGTTAIEIRARYVNKSVAHYFRKGAANPVTYLNC